MENRYDTKCLDFFCNVLNFTKPLRSEGNTISPDLLDGLKTVSLHPNWFTKNHGDYRAYYAFLDAYHAIVDYYEYRAKYNKKDERLENALRNWYKVIQSKQNIFVKILRNSNNIKIK